MNPWFSELNDSYVQICFSDLKTYKLYQCSLISEQNDSYKAVYFSSANTYCRMSIVWFLNKVTLIKWACFSERKKKKLDQCSLIPEQNDFYWAGLF